MKETHVYVKLKFSFLNQKDFRGDHALEWNVILIFVIISDLFSALQASMLSGLMFHSLVSSALPILIIFPPCAWRSSPTHRLFALSMKRTLCKILIMSMESSICSIAWTFFLSQGFLIHSLSTLWADQESLTWKMSLGSSNAEIVPRPRSLSKHFLRQNNKHLLT